MDRTNDIKFLQGYRAAVALYLGPAGVRSASGERAYKAANRLQEYGKTQLAMAQAQSREHLRQTIAEGRGRAHNLLAECNCARLVKAKTLLAMMNFNSDTVTYRLLDLILDNPLEMDFPTTQFTDAIDEAIGQLKAMKTTPTAQEAQVIRVAAAGNESERRKSALKRLERIARRFPCVVDQLRLSRAGRPNIEIKNEYDVQYAFKALVAVDFDDIRPEEPVPSLAGSSTRADFLLGKSGIFVEVKMTRAGLGHKEVKEQLLIDIPQYQKHPDCKVIVAFVYDPGRQISNPLGFERDLSKQYDGVPAYVYVVQG